MQKTYPLTAALCLLGAASLSAQGLDWPEVKQETKPWTRWWWQGSAVNQADLASSLGDYAKAGLGGVEITPIYGVRGYEDQFIDYLSPKWVERLEFTLAEAQRLGLGVDMATGTGWPFGGPSVPSEDACRYLAHRSYALSGGESLAEPIRFDQEPIVRSVTNQIYQTTLGIPSAGETDRSTARDPLLRGDARPLRIDDLVEPIEENENLQALALDQIRFPKPLPLQTVMAYSEDGHAIELTDRVAPDGTLDWVAPSGNWTLYAIFIGWHGKMVERAAPAGEGNVIDHFASEAIRNYLRAFDDALGKADLSGLRSYFNDSYEVDDASGQSDWTPEFFAAFQQRRGYDLRAYLPALFGDDQPESNARVLADYRLTVSDLLLETFTEEWADWAKRHGKRIRNQAHGSPANLLDLYAASDIPETESLDPLRVKWGSSAANVTGKPLVSAEAATWLDEHFHPTLNDVRRALDHFFLSGVNHIVYHGTNYSPSEENWPGWLFYATTHFNPRNSWWTDFDALNRYVTRVQSFLQTGSPDNDILLYFPAYADYAAPGSERLKYYGKANQQIDGSDFLALYRKLQKDGYALDFLSDRQLLETTVESGKLHTQGNRYATIVVPDSDYIELASLEKLFALAEAGATVLFHQALPSDVAGVARLPANRMRYARLKDSLDFAPSDFGQVAALGKGRVALAERIDDALPQTGAARETLPQQGLDFLRRRDADATIYFLANRGDADFQGWSRLAKGAAHVALFDPMSQTFGYTASRQSDTGDWEVYLEIPAGESLVALSAPARRSGPDFPFYTARSDPSALSGDWTVTFLQGGPSLPAPQSLEAPQSWTEFDGGDYDAFSGTAAYTLRFQRPSGKADAWRLDLGTVHQSAEVFLNGTSIGTTFGPAYRLLISPKQLKRNNTLEVRVSNRMANRIAYLDQNDVFWKKHYNVNFPARRSANRGEDGLFTAKHWTPAPSGLVGPVTLTALEQKR